MQIKFHNISIGMRFLDLFKAELAWGSKDRKLRGIAVWFHGTKVTDYKMTSVPARVSPVTHQLWWTKDRASELKRPLKITAKICDKTTSA